MSVSPIDRPLAQASYEQDAKKRIAAAQQNVNRIEKESAQAVEEIKQEGIRQYESQAVHQDDALNRLKSTGYEKLRDSKRLIDSELRKLRSEGENEVDRLKKHYRAELRGIEREGQAKIDEEQQTLHHLVEYEQKMGQLTEEQIQSLGKARSEALRQEIDQNIATSRADQQTQLEQIRENASESIKTARESHEKRFHETMAEQNDVIRNIENQASQELNHLKQDTAQKLAAYGSRQRDPFYRLVDLMATVHEDPEGYTVTAQVPEYMQDRIRLNVSNNQLTISGFRANEDSSHAPGEPIRKTASYQAFHETFPLGNPVDTKKLERTFRGDQLVIKIPKLKYHYRPYEVKKDPKIEKTNVEIPHFPESLKVKSVKKSDAHETDTFV